ncbi:hypothetical protein [Siccibacter turicensis]
MRITVLDDDPGERIPPGREFITVYLDGEEVKQCLTADDVKGEVVSIETDEGGRVLMESGEVKRLTRYGEVRTERCPR